MSDDLRTSFDRARAEGHSTVSRWLLEPGGLARLAEYAVLERPEITDASQSVMIGGVALRAAPAFLAALSRYCVDHHASRVTVLRAARARYPAAADIDAMTAFLEDEA